MKLIAETQEEELQLKRIEGLLHKYGGLDRVLTYSFEEGLKMSLLMSALSPELPKCLCDWTSEQRSIFFEGCQKELSDVAFKDFDKILPLLVNNYDIVFNLRDKAFLEAVNDYKLLKDVLWSINSLKIKSFKNVRNFIKNSVSKKDGIKTISAYLDSEPVEFVIELNHIKVPIEMLEGLWTTTPIVYAWNDSSFSFSYEFFRVDLEKELCKYNKNGFILDSRIVDAQNRIKKQHVNTEEKSKDPVLSF